MTTTAFDTLAYAKRLRAAGFPETQAEALAEALAQATGQELVSKTYLDARLEATKNELVRWMAGMLVAQAAVVAALVKLFS